MLGKHNNLCNSHFKENLTEILFSFMVKNIVEKKSKRIKSLLEFIKTNSGEWNISLHCIPQNVDQLGKHLSLKRLKNLKQSSNDPQQLCSILKIFLLNSSRFCNRTSTKWYVLLFKDSFLNCFTKFK